MALSDDKREWLETDGLGGFAHGTVSLRRTRRYHALLLVNSSQPPGRFVLINGCEVFVTTQAGRYPLSSQRYVPEVIYPEGDRWQESFRIDSWPEWTWKLPDGTRISLRLFMVQGSPLTVMRWSLLSTVPADPVLLSVRWLMSGRDYHSLHHENPAFRFAPRQAGACLTWAPYDGVPEIQVRTNGAYRHDPVWYRQFFYEVEQERGLDAVEDLASPGEHRFDLRQGAAVALLSAGGAGSDLYCNAHQVVAHADESEALERARRLGFSDRLQRSANQFLVNRGGRKSIIAGYPWFTDWGRDTFISLRGLCQAPGDRQTVRNILLSWAPTISEGMIPNRFPDYGEPPEYNSVDASLWYVVVIHEYLQAALNNGTTISESDRRILEGAVEAILEGYAAGTRFGIGSDNDGLLKAGIPGLQLTWMDAKVGDWVVTPRIGKPVEVQALWLNALWAGARFSRRWETLFQNASSSFRARFWNAPRGYLFDVVDDRHEPGRVDDSLRPNQIFAVGGLPLTLLDTEQSRRVVDVVEQRLWTPLGLRTLDPAAHAYHPHYLGNITERDAAYHQGTVWPWLLGPFVEAWVRVRGNTGTAKREARARFLPPLQAHLLKAGLEHVSEIVDAEPTSTSAGAVQAPRGCPFQAWSLGELMRLHYVVLASAEAASPPGAKRRGA